MQRILLTEEKTFFIVDASVDYHCQYGIFKAEDLKKGGVIESNKGKKATAAEPQFIDYFSKIKRGPQIIPKKDVGVIITKTGMGRDAVIVDAGTGSGAMAISLANIAKKVTSYELREDFFKVATKNVEKLGLKNLKIKNQDVREGIDEKNVDMVMFDLPDPWMAIESAAKALKPGGFLVSYSPTIPQVMDFVSKLDKRFLIIDTIEIIERQWEINQRKVRPKSQQIGHSAFLTFARRR